MVVGHAPEMPASGLLKLSSRTLLVIKQADMTSKPTNPRSTHSISILLFMDG